MQGKTLKTITIKIVDNDPYRVWSITEKNDLKEKIMDHFFNNIPDSPDGIELAFD